MKRFPTLILILALMVAFAAPTFAQTGDCGDLSEEDCEILYASAEAMQGVTSGTSSIWVDAQISNVPQTPFRQLAFDFSLDVTSSMNDEAAEMAMDLASAGGDMSMLAHHVSAILKGTAASVAMTTNFSDELVALLSTDPNVAWPASVALNLAMGDGIVYIDLSTLEAMMGEGAEGWLGVDVDPFVQGALQEVAADPATGGVVVVSGSTTSGGPLFTQLGVLDPTGEVSQFLTIERLDDDEVDGEAVAVFSTGINWDAFVQSVYFEQLIATLLMQADEGAMPTQAEIEQTVTIGRMFGPALLENIQLELIEMVSLDSDYLVATDFTLFWDLNDLAMLAGMAGVEFEAEGDSVIFVSIMTSNSDLNEDVTIDIPADAFIVPAEMLLQ
jgi:hypothetical protein